ncbi:hypothetical protein [Haloarcula laminariae]|uniref:hypothetical protein n=1 Tax=Haloarcula laminariae TaxID=2961577 RepID=UPI0024073C10|nr:hypothetical protein [Halomicroarcula sp. FL173]
MTRNTRIAVDDDELAKFKEVKQMMFPEIHEEVAHGTALRRLCEEFEKRKELVGERQATDGER